MTRIVLIARLLFAFWLLPSLAWAEELSQENVREEAATETIGDVPLIHSILEDSGEGYRLVLSAIDLSFATNGTRLPQRSQRYLDAISKVLANESESFDTIEISGHTDNLGPVKLNKKLSRARASGVAAIFKKSGIRAGKIQTKSLAAKEAIADNGSEDGRRQNRRVEILIKSSPEKIESLARKLAELDQTYRLAHLSMQR